MTYILDTNFFIETKNFHLPLEKHPSFWSWLLGLATQKIVSMPEQVYEELAAGNDDLAEWIKNNKASFVNGVSGFSTITRVTSDGYGLEIDEAILEKLKADPWVIASAASINGTVVTSEKPARGRAPHNKKIVDVCDVLKIPHLTITAFLWEMRASMPS